MTIAEVLHYNPELYFILPPILLVGLFLIAVFFKQGQVWSKINAIEELKLSWASYASPSSLRISQSNIGVKMKILENAIVINLFNTQAFGSVLKIYFTQIKIVSFEHALLSGQVIAIILRDSNFILKFSASNDVVEKFLRIMKGHSVPASAA